MVELDNRTQGLLELGSAALVLVTALVDTYISLGIAVIALASLAAYKLLHAHNEGKK
jgi:hypothetical protein